MGGKRAGEGAGEEVGGADWFNDRDHFLTDVEDEGDYHRMIQMQCTLPGACKLEISCMDYDTMCIDPDDLIGTTVIDLEERVFDKRWKQWNKQQWERHAGSTGGSTGGSNASGIGAKRTGTGSKGIGMGSTSGSSAYNRYADNKPIETRSLQLPTSTHSQGRLVMWLDIMTHAEARLHPEVDISLPPEELYEVSDLLILVYQVSDLLIVAVLNAVQCHTHSYHLLLLDNLLAPN
jgi:hypothetical protein